MIYITDAFTNIASDGFDEYLETQHYAIDSNAIADTEDYAEDNAAAAQHAAGLPLLDPYTFDTSSIELQQDFISFQ